MPSTCATSASLLYVNEPGVSHWSTRSMSLKGPVLAPDLVNFFDWNAAMPVTVAPSVFVVEYASAAVKLFALAVA